MPRYILDTDMLTLYQRKQPRVVTAVRSHQHDTAVTIITLQEQFTGWHTTVLRARRPDALATAYRNWTDAANSSADLEIIAFDEPAIGRYKILLGLRPNIGRMDLRIAAIALEAGATVVTRNRVDFGRIPGLAIVDWSV
jgi:tRNA(fMet)-specific endonuclease VapC